MEVIYFSTLPGIPKIFMKRLQENIWSTSGIISSRQPFVLFSMEIVILTLPKEKNIPEEGKDQVLHHSISRMPRQNLHAAKSYSWEIGITKCSSSPYWNLRFWKLTLLLSKVTEALMSWSVKLLQNWQKREKQFRFLEKILIC